MLVQPREHPNKLSRAPLGPRAHPSSHSWSNIKQAVLPRTAHCINTKHTPDRPFSRREAHQGSHGSREGRLGACSWQHMQTLPHALVSPAQSSSRLPTSVARWGCLPVKPGYRPRPITALLQSSAHLGTGVHSPVMLLYSGARSGAEHPSKMLLDPPPPSPRALLQILATTNITAKPWPFEWHTHQH